MFKKDTVEKELKNDDDGITNFTKRLFIKIILTVFEYY